MATSGRNEEGLPKIIDANIIKALVADNETQQVGCSDIASSLTDTP